MDSSSSDISSTSSDEELFNYLRGRRRAKVIKSRRDHFQELNDEEFFHRFRFSKGTVATILENIEGDIKFDSLRNNCLSPMQQLLLTLRYYASGCMLITVGDFIGVTKARASRIVNRVSQAIAGLHLTHIRMPQSEEEIREVQAGFYAISKFPKVIATIDCTHVKIQSPGSDDAEVYRNRKGYFSYNVQTMCDHNLKITNIVARWPGSTHDQTIFNNSRIKAKFEERTLYKEYFILGDSGYKNTEYLLTPLLRPNNAAEELYNNVHIKTRNTVERQYGVWKRRFPILSLGMRVSNDLAKVIIVATAVLHNIAIDAREPVPVDDDIVVEAMESYEGVGVDEGVGIDNLNRQRLINNYFTTLL